MATPLSMPAVPTAVPSLWRGLSGLRFLRRLLGMANDQPAPANHAREGLGTFDWDEPDTSLTQAELEVLK